MGTRNLTAVRVGKEIKVAQYGQWDGYPTGQGDTISVFLRSADLERFKRCVETLKWYTPKQIEKVWNDAGADGSGFVSMEISDIVRKEHPELSRDTGADILDLIYKGKIAKVDNQWDFIKDGLFCEYAYLLGLDKQVVEVYTGRYETDSNGTAKENKTIPLPTMTIPFEEFAQEGRMEVLEDELNEEED